ncbi:hypothetical protein PHYPSEUDO_008594 [Phytophthora pseudosyringae]|uniref:Transmembrane protein n=1 Tax=Phytophthora pseudosyringae TaxID=221518 RepID=A0A8T1WD73_9STRA|nr:hypothetical protein PHYPSEUDO_008594 [Phytophthora pseudosyringae]
MNNQRGITNPDVNHAQYAKKSSHVVQRGLQVLFHWEYVTLVEYVECIVPLVFVTYKSVLEQLPNVLYYPGGTGSWTSASAVNILVFGALEVGSFLILKFYLQRKFSFSPFYETQVYSVQTKLFIETVLLLQYELAHLGNSQVAAFVPGLNFTIAKRIMAAVGVSGCYVGTCLLAASWIGFPVPLMMQFGVVPIAIYIAVVTRMILGPALVAKDSPFKEPSDVFHRFFFAHMTLIGVYPLFKVLYSHVPLAYRSIVVIILPIWKFAAKCFVVRSSRQLEDYMPELVAFSVDFFGTLFVSVCMYTSGSIYLSGLFILANLSQSLLEFREVHSNAKIVLELLEDRRATQDCLPRKKGRRLSRFGNAELLTMLIAITRNPRAYNVKCLHGARLWSCLPHPIAQEQLGHLQMLEASGVYVQGSTDLSSQRPTVPRYPRFLQRVSVSPSPAPLAAACSPDTIVSEDSSSSRRADRSKKLVLQGLQLLFHCEYLALVEYGSLRVCWI